MRIAIDISQIVYGTGVSVYTKNLVDNLLRIDRENEYVLFAGSLRRKKDILSIYPSAKIFPIPPTLADFMWNRLHILPIEKLIGNIDVFHTSDWWESAIADFLWERELGYRGLGPLTNSTAFNRPTSD